MQRIEAEATRMGALVEDLLTLARVYEHPQGGRERVDLAVIATYAVADAIVRAATRSIRLEGDHATIVEAQPRAIRRAIDNLLANAVAHTPDGTSIEVQLDHRARQACVSVRDHGPGTPPEGMTRCSSASGGANAGRSRGGGGSGLGLAIVRELLAVRAEAARCRSRTHPEGGAVFIVTLPPARSAKPDRD